MLFPLNSSSISSVVRYSFKICQPGYIKGIFCCWCQWLMHAADAGLWLHGGGKFQESGDQIDDFLIHLSRCKGIASPERDVALQFLGTRTGVRITISHSMEIIFLCGSFTESFDLSDLE